MNPMAKSEGYGWKAVAKLENENRHIACLGTCHPSVDVIVFEIGC